jgi:hypothetical protein
VTRPQLSLARDEHATWAAAVAGDRDAFAGPARVDRRALSALRRPILTWGARNPRRSRQRLPGDALLEDADGASTRTIALGARAASVWPWLAQMGPSPRGCAYTYDWIENLLGLAMHSVDRILPEYQQPSVGDTIGFDSNRMRLERVEPGRVLAWRSEDGNWVWTFVLDEQDGRRPADLAARTARLFSKFAAPAPHQPRQHSREGDQGEKDE